MDIWGILLAGQFSCSSSAPLTRFRLDSGLPSLVPDEIPFPTHRNLPDPQDPADVAKKVVIQAGSGCPHGTEVSGQQAQQALAFLHPFTRTELC